MDKSEKAVYLTFDDGPIPEATPFILDTLKEFDAKATFFMVGENVQRYPELFKRIKAEGHQVGNHTYNHLGSLRHFIRTYVNNTQKANELIQSHLFRPPHGWMLHGVYELLRIRYHYKIIMWDVVTRDYSRSLLADDIVRNVKRYARNGSIITFHDSLKSIEKLQYALPASLRYLKEQGYAFKIID